MGAQQQEQQDVLDTIFSCQRSGLPFSKDTPVLICLAGFPDTASVWDPLVHRPELATSHHVIAMGLPGNHLNELPADHKWGYTIDEIQEALHRVVLYCHRNGAKIIHLLCHDWGANYGYLYVQEHKDEALVQKYAALDIGIFNPYQMPKVGMLKFIGYMLWFAFVFVTNNLIGSNMASKLIKVYPWKLIGPLNDEETSIFLQGAIKTPHLTYPYFQLFRNFARAKTSFSKTKHLPVCFMYGTSKNINYHSKVYLSQLDKTPGCSFVGLNGGHWFYAEKTNAPIVANALQKFFLDK